MVAGGAGAAELPAAQGREAHKVGLASEKVSMRAQGAGQSSGSFEGQRL